MEATRTEVLANASGKVLNAWSDSADKTKFAVGAGVEVEAAVALSDR